MSFHTALSGLNAAQTEISVTSNNIANVGTVGFHGSRANFADIYANSPYIAASAQVGTGTRLSGVERSFAQGNVTVTQNTFDLALQGPGFFRLQTEFDGGSAVYSRAGAFGLNSAGQVVNAAGHHLAVYPTAEDGSPISLQATRALTVPPVIGEAVATSEVDMTLRLPAGVAGQGSQAAIPPAPFDPADAGTYAHSTPINLIDADGQARQAMAYFVQTDTPDAADPATRYEMRLVVDGAEATPAGGAAPVLSFDADGALTGGASSVFTSFGADLTVDITGSTLGGTGFSVASMRSNGEVPRGLSGLEIDGSGVVWASYGGTEAIALGKIAVAQFNNPTGLKSLGDSSYAQTRESGQASFGEAMINGFGQIRSGALEQANVNLTEELVDLITAQRNYQASAKALETNQALAQTIMNMR
ncbi:MAG: flagellar hook protein FlgE [Roseicyclus sp.]|nr:flagellar hook protein FlgE [Roseicyclus sp.]